MLSMFRLKIGVVAVATVIVLVILLLFFTTSPFSSAADEQVQSAVRRASRLVQRSQRLYAFDLVSQARSVANQGDFVAGVQESDEKQRRAAVFDALNEKDKQLSAKGQKPAFFGVLDHKGRIIARDLDPNADYGDRFSYPVVDRVLKTGQASSGVFLLKNLMMRAGVAPIIQTLPREGSTPPTRELLGAVVIAYDFTSAEARLDRDHFGAHVAYFMGNAVRASSFTVAGDPNTEDAGMVGALTQSLQDAAKKAMAEQQTSDVLDVTIQGQQFKAITGPLPPPVTLSTYGRPDAKPLQGTSGGKEKLGYVVLASVDQAMAPVWRARWIVLGFGVLLLLLVMVNMAAVARHFVTIEDQVELGVNEVINGNLDYIFDARGEFEGLANALNVMLARLLGRPEPGEEEDGDQSWRPDVIAVDELSTDAQLARQLAAEAEDQYFARLYREYVDARARLNLTVEGITQEGLTQKLRANEAMLKAKNKCRMVRFVVTAAAGRVSFRPIRID